LPRNDIFFKKDQREIFSSNKFLQKFKKYSKIFLYTPTWRDSSNTIKPFSEKLLENLNKYLKQNNYILLIS
jgi:CDP-glycerol glycerophosphotransferase (TagB/SpsB family)